MEQSEEWRPVAGYEGHYEVSSAGQVRRLSDGHICHQRVQQATMVVRLKTRSGSPSNYSVARLVAIAFNGKPPAGYFLVRHKDGDSKNNRPDNLYWVSSSTFVNSEESRRKAAAKRRSPEVRAKLIARSKARWSTPDGKALLLRMSQKACAMTSKKVICLETGVIYPSVLSAADAFGFSKRAVLSSCQRAGGCKKNRMYHGTSPVFHFRYYNPEEWKPKERIWRPVPVPDICDKYEVSNLGEVRRTKDHTLLTNSSASKNRYIFVSLYSGGKTRQYHVSHLVADAFIPRQYGLPFVSHRDGDAMNNCVTNLVRSNGSIACNAPFGRANRLAGCRHARSVLCIETGAVYESMSAAARAIGSTISTVKCSCDKREAGTVAYWKKRHRGKPVYHFRYADQ